jgi:hypothetical protein
MSGAEALLIALCHQDGVLRMDRYPFSEIDGYGRILEDGGERTRTAEKERGPLYGDILSAHVAPWKPISLSEYPGAYPTSASRHPASTSKLGLTFLYGTYLHIEF